MNKKQKYYFFYLKTGGGHLAPARSLKNYILKKYSEKAEPVLIDGFEKTPRFFRYIIEDGYRKLQYKAAWFYETLYAVNKFPPAAYITAFIVSLFCKKYIHEVLVKDNPEKIIVLHFFLIKPVYDAVKKYKLRTKIYTAVTDPYTAHPLWFLRSGQNYILFSERLSRHVQQIRPESRVHVFPFVLDEKFSVKIADEKIPKIKDELGLPQNKKILLVMGGGDGIPHGEKIIEEILKEKTDAFIVIVCGRNKPLFEAAQRLRRKYNVKDMMIFGFVDFVYELLNASDILITKCGASTMMEILMMNKVPVVNDYIWEQEKGNIEFLIENHLGIYEPEINKLPFILKKLIDDREYYDSFKKNISSLQLKNGTADVSEFLVNEEEF